MYTESEKQRFCLEMFEFSQKTNVCMTLQNEQEKLGLVSLEGYYFNPGYVLVTTFQG